MLIKDEFGIKIVEIKDGGSGKAAARYFGEGEISWIQQLKIRCIPIVRATEWHSLI